ncbi:phosphoesterase, PA-phosphatase related protein [Roseobacter sp. CCS2]|nr:phosphoesterase, PA-phosphatase related protein [Roseobacter sp. CCS2]
MPVWNGEADPALKPRIELDPFRQLDQLAKIPREVVIDTRLFPLFQAVDGNVQTPLKTNVAPPLVKLTPPDPVVDFWRKAELRHVRDAADLRNDRLNEITYQIDDITSFFAAALRLDADRSEWTLEWLEAVVRLCGYVEFPLKFTHNIPRPADYSSRVYPVVETPKHGTWPSGHATEAFAIATVLSGLVFEITNPGNAPFRVKDAIAGSTTVANLLFRIATRIADNRTIGGLHFPTDSYAGAFCGIGIGEALVNHMRKARCTTVIDYAPVEATSQDFSLAHLQAAIPATTENLNQADPDDLLLAMWKAVIAELPRQA